MFRADLHIHSTYSDGSFSPEEIVKEAVNIGLSAISITDHDSIGAYSKILGIAKSLGIKIITGVELSSLYEEERIHVLGYSFSLHSKVISNFCQYNLNSRERRNKKILELLKKNGMPISLKEIEDTLPVPIKGGLGRTHIANAMVTKGYANSIQDAFKNYLGDEKEFGLCGKFHSTEDAINAIQRAGGKAFLAHPYLIKKRGVLSALLEMNFDGIECYHSISSFSTSEKLVKIAREKNMMVVGGSDFHGVFKPQINLGASFTNENSFEILYDIFKSHAPY